MLRALTSLGLYPPSTNSVRFGSESPVTHRCSCSLNERLCFIYPTFSVSVPWASPKVLFNFSSLVRLVWHMHPSSLSLNLGSKELIYPAFIAWPVRDQVLIYLRLKTHLPFWLIGVKTWARKRAAQCLTDAACPWNEWQLTWLSHDCPRKRYYLWYLQGNYSGTLSLYSL